MVLLVDVMSSVLALDKHYNEDIEHPHSLGIYYLFLDVRTFYNEAFCYCNMALLSGLFLDVSRWLWNQ